MAVMLRALVAAIAVGAVTFAASAQTSEKKLQRRVAPRSSFEAEFLKDATLTGTLYYWQRERRRKDLKGKPKYKTNLSHGTFNAGVDFQSGYIRDFVGLDLGLYAILTATEGPGSSHPNEIGFSSSRRAYEEDWAGDESGISFYKAAAKFKYGDSWLRAGFLQPMGQTLLAPHWSFLPGTYQGAEIGTSFDFGEKGALAVSYMWANAYKAPWYTDVDSFYRWDKKTRIDYLDSIGFKYDFKNNVLLEAAYGRAHGYIDQYFAKISRRNEAVDHTLSLSYQFYGTHDRVAHDNITVPSKNNDLYDGLAWLQGVTMRYERGPFDWRVEATWVRAKGNQGFFLQRMTPSYGSSNGRLDIWWDNRSDFNANGEKAVYTGLFYNLADWQFPGWTVGASYVYGWDAKPSTYHTFDQHQRLRESAYSLDLIYKVQKGWAKDTQIKLHFTKYDNHSNIPSFGGGFGNIFQDERDIKFIIIAPFSLL